MPALLALLLLACDEEPPSPAAPADTGETAVPTACTEWTYAAAEPTLYTLPAGESFPRADLDADCDEGTPTSRLVDLTGDGRLDLVAHTDCDDTSVGQGRWRVWPGEAGGFGAEITWTLPSGYGVGAFVVGSRVEAVCTTEGVDIPAFFLADIDGDGADDLVVSDSCADSTLADGAWRVYPNTGTGFGDAVDHPLPTDYGEEAFVAPRGSEECEGPRDFPAWGVVDLDGDGPVDIAVTDTCNGSEVGYTYWTVHYNDGAAFAAGADWALPTQVLVNSFARAEGGCSTGFPSFFLLDAEGDGLLDVVTPDVCTSSGNYWYVYRNLGTGFATDGEPRIAPWGLGALVDQIEHAAPDCDRSLPAWVIDDATGDGYPDLTFTASCSDTAVGDTRWTLYPGGPEGWARAIPIALPTGYSGASFAGTDSTTGCGGSANHPAWVRRDLDGDGVPELIVTETCDDTTVGESAWRVYTATCAN